jgi:(p)ppGpp synthase/HD superfamily hydrolase
MDLNLIWRDFDTFNCIVSAAFLHDVVEDTDITIEDLRRDFSSLTCHMVEALTKRKGESYFDFIMRVSGTHLHGAKYIKICDITHNMSDANEKEKMSARYAKYELSRYILRKSLNSLNYIV